MAIMVYASAAKLFLGAFIPRYGLELVLSLPLIALVMADYLAIAYKDDNAAQAPENLYRERGRMVAVVVCSLGTGSICSFDNPALHIWFTPTASVQMRMAL